MRVRKIKNVESKAKEEQKIIQPSKEMLNREHLLQGKTKLFAEFGTGKGGFLKELSLREPNHAFFGVDKYLDIIYRASKNIGERDNVFLCAVNIDQLEEYLMPNTFDGLYLNFSDPWPKAKHYKRRLTYRKYLDLYDILLKEGSLVKIKTDDPILFAFTLEELFATGRQAFDISRDVYNDSRFTENIQTEYEVKFSVTRNIQALSYRTRKAIK